MYKYVLVILTMCLMVLSSCSFGESNNLAVVEPRDDDDIMDQISYFDINFINLPNEGKYYGGDTIIFDLRYNISNEDVNDTILPLFIVSTIGTSFGTYMNVETSETDSSSTMRLLNRQDSIRIMTTLYNKELTLNDTLPVLTLDFEIQFDNLDTPYARNVDYHRNLSCNFDFYSYRY